MNSNEFSLINNKIGDNRQEKIAFVIDMNDEVFKDDFIGGVNLSYTSIIHIFKN
jgi:hypothetical protein